MTLFGSDAGEAIDFRPKWKVSLWVSLFLVVVSAGALVFRGLNLSSEFEGGTVWEVPAAGSEVTIQQVEDAISSLVDARVQEISDISGSRETVKIESGPENQEVIDAVRTELATISGTSYDDIRLSATGSKWGEEITSKAIRALVFFFIAVALYLAWTLEWRMAAGALVAVLHDLIITAGVYSFFGFEVTPSTVIALLTILGYSLYDTVVVYDKIRENENNPLVSSGDYSSLVNSSMNQVVMRSINTTITTVVPVLSMLLVGGVFLKADTLTSFALALFIGLLLGVYSSIFVAAPLIVHLRNLEPESRRQARIEEKRLAAKERGSSSEVADSGESFSPVENIGSIQAKPRKKKKR